MALITGSTRGIGLAIGLRLQQEGYRVALNYAHHPEQAERALSQIPRARVFQADVTRWEEAQGLVERVVAELGGLDVLVNNLGVFLERSVWDTSPEEWEWLLAGVLSSTFYCTKAVLPRFREQGAGQIVNIGSLNAEVARGAPNSAVYNAAKTAVMVLTKSLARSEGGHGIRVNAVNPGMIRTEASEGQQARARQVPLGRLGLPQEVAAAVAFLLSAEAAYLNGAVINVHGGLWV